MSDLKEKLKELKETSFTVLEASSLTGSGDNTGGRIAFGDNFAPDRQVNPFRALSSQRSANKESTAQWSAKVGNAQNGSTNPWGYVVQPNIGNPDTNAVFWSLPIQTVNAQISVRTAAIEDVNALQETLQKDVMQELSQLEALSMVRNSDQSTATPVNSNIINTQQTITAAGFGQTMDIPVASTTGFNAGDWVQITPQTGSVIPATSGTAAFNRFGPFRVIGAGTFASSVKIFVPTNQNTTIDSTIQLTKSSAYGGAMGLRGLDQYVGAPASGAATSSAFGSSGNGQTFGIHSIATLGVTLTDLNSGTAATSTTAANIINALDVAVQMLPSQYWTMQGTAWMMHPGVIQQLRQFKDSAGQPIFLEIGDFDAAPVGMVRGFPVIPNPYLSAGFSGSFPIYLGNWPSAVEFVDHDDITLKLYEQTQPGTSTIFAQKRVAFSVKDPFALVRIRAV